MGVLRTLESKLEGLVEGAFSRAFRARVQPVELARRLAKEMDSYKTVSVSRTYVPNEYTVFLAREDRRQFENYEQALLDELSQHLLEHAAEGDDGSQGDLGATMVYSAAHARQIQRAAGAAEPKPVSRALLTMNGKTFV